MERSANYAAVGAFVLVVTLIGALFVYWYTDTREHRDYNRYEMYFDGTVSGLEQGLGGSIPGRRGRSRGRTCTSTRRDSSRVR